MAMKSSLPTAAPAPPLRQGQRLGIVVDEGRAARSARPAGCAGGTRARPGCSAARPSRRRAIGPPQPTPHTTGSATGTGPPDQRRQRAEHRLGVVGWPGWGPRRPRLACPSSSTRPAASLVPPTSTARLNGRQDVRHHDGDAGDQRSRRKRVRNHSRARAPRPRSRLGRPRLSARVRSCQPALPICGGFARRHRRGEHDGHAEKADEHGLGVEGDQDGDARHEADGRPLAVAAGVAVDGLGADALGELGVLTDEGLLQLRQDPLLMLRERHGPHLLALDLALPPPWTASPVPRSPMSCSRTRSRPTTRSVRSQPLKPTRPAV